MVDVIALVILFLFLGGLLFLANMADAQRENGESGRGWAAACYAVLALIYVVSLFGGALVWIGVAAMKANPDLAKQVLNSSQVNPLEAMENPALFGLGLAVPSFFGLLLLLPPIRRLFSFFTNIDPRSSVHALSLSLSMLVIIQIVVLLGMGMGNLAEAASQTNSSAGSQLITLWVQQLCTAALGFVGVGFLVRRNWSETLERLGLVIPTFRQVSLAIGAAFVLVIVVIVVGAISDQTGFGVDKDVEKLTEQLMGALFESPWGILTAGLSAALGEEILIRGALQPRFGILLATIVFALLHSQYGLSLSTLIVFIVGLILGIIRQRENTSTSMIVHALYNMTLSTLTYLGVNFLNQ
ncbi:MAG: type II CAAX endopeptidase family protein [Caldilineaceae bacterium]